MSVFVVTVRGKIGGIRATGCCANATSCLASALRREIRDGFRSASGGDSLKKKRTEREREIEAYDWLSKNGRPEIAWLCIKDIARRVGRTTLGMGAQMSRRLEKEKTSSSKYTHKREQRQKQLERICSNPVCFVLMRLVQALETR